MTIGLVGRKCGMTRIFTADGASIPVTVIEIEANRVTQVKTVDKDGYAAVQVTTGSRRPSRVTKALAGHYAKAEAPAGRGLWEFLSTDQHSVGDQFNADVFQAGQAVDVIATSKGKGFAGTVKSHNFATQDATHGNSVSHRVPGSTGQNQSPGRVFKGKRMAGHLGSKRVTVEGLEIVRVDAGRNLLLIKGAVPGAPGGDVVVRPSLKARA